MKTVFFERITLSEVQMKTRDELSIFIQSEFGLVHHKKDHIKIGQFTKFEVLSLDCNQVEGFQKSVKLITHFVSGIWGASSQNYRYL